MFIYRHTSVQFSSVAHSCPTLCDPMNHTTPSLPVHHQLPEFTQTHVHQVSDAIQPSHPLSPLLSCLLSCWNTVLNPLLGFFVSNLFAFTFPAFHSFLLLLRVSSDNITKKYAFPLLNKIWTTTLCFP